MAEREIFYFYDFKKKLTEMPPTNCKIHGNNFKEIL